jgi:hypothetical protein
LLLAGSSRNTESNHGCENKTIFKPGFIEIHAFGDIVVVCLRRIPFCVQSENVRITGAILVKIDKINRG